MNSGVAYVRFYTRAGWSKSRMLVALKSGRLIWLRRHSMVRILAEVGFDDEQLEEINELAFQAVKKLSGHDYEVGQELLACFQDFLDSRLSTH